MDEKQIAISISTKLKDASTKELKDYADQLSRIQAFSKGLDKGALKQIDSSADGLKDNNKQLEQIAKNTRNSFNIQGITAFLRSAKTLVTTLGKMTEKSSAYRENINLYRVAFEDSTAKADEFIAKLTEMYGLDESWLTRTVGTFKQLSNAMGLSVEQGTNLSTLMSQMALDISSLYNVNVDRASTVLQSALAGQTRPIRSLTGADITQNTLQNTLDTIGIDKAVSKLSFAEKRLLIIISLTQQLDRITNDYGNTIDQPANQTKILAQQWERLSRAVGNVFMPILAKVLPYLNAIVMVLTEIINAVAKFVARLFNFDLEGRDSPIAGATNAFIDMEESITGASDSAKKLKSGLRGFDKLNVISTPSSGSSGGGAGGGGIDPSIMDAFNKSFEKYQSMIKDVRMKALDIRDAILGWLGFTRDENGELKFTGIKFGTIAGALAGIVGSLGALGAVYNIIKKIGEFTGLTKLFASLGSIASVIGPILAVAGAIALIGKAMYDLYQNNEDFAKSVNDKWAEIQQSIEPITSKLVELFETLKVLFKETLVPVFGEFYEIIQTVGQTLIEILYPIFKDVLIPVIELLIDVIKDVFNTVNELWSTYGEPISTAIQESILSLITTFNKLWEQVLKPIIEKIMEIVNDLWDNTLKPIFKKVGEVIGELIELVLALWDNVLQPLVNWFIDVLGPHIETAISFVLDVFHNFGKIIGGVINGVLDVIKGIIKFITGVFKGDWKKAWNGVADVFRGIINVIISVAEGMVNSVITLINLMIKAIFNGVKSLVNKVLNTVENIADFLGKDIDISVKGQAPQIPLVSIPRLEKGMDFVPSDFYGPVFLDYGERVLTKQENREYSQQKGMLSSNSSPNNNNMSLNPTFIIQVGSKEVARTVLTDLQDMAKSNGKPITIQG